MPCICVMVSILGSVSRGRGVVADVAKANLLFLSVIWATATSGGKCWQDGIYFNHCIKMLPSM